MIPRIALELASMASAENSRFTLNGIRVEPGRTVVTDGHLLVLYEFTPGKAESFPVVEGAIPVDDFKPFILPKDAALQIAKGIPRKQTIPILSNAAIVGDPDANGEVKLVVTDLERHQAFNVKKLTGTFPDYNCVVPKPEDATCVIGFNADLLCRVLSYLGKVSDGDTPSKHSAHPVTLRFYGPDKAVRIDAAGDNCHATGMVMPLQTDDPCKGAKAPARPDLDVPTYIQEFLDSTNRLLAAGKLSTDQALAVQKIFAGINDLSKTLSAPEPGPGIPVEVVELERAA